MKSLLVIFLIILGLSSLSIKERTKIIGEWIVCGDKIDLRIIDSVRFIKRVDNFNYKICEDNGICKYSSWELTENKRITLSSYIGCPDLPTGMASSNHEWKRWDLNKDQSELLIHSWNKTSIKFKIVRINDNELIIKK